MQGHSVAAAVEVAQVVGVLKGDAALGFGCADEPFLGEGIALGVGLTVARDKKRRAGIADVFQLEMVKYVSGEYPSTVMQVARAASMAASMARVASV